MALENNEVLQTLMERKTTLEQQIQEGNMQLLADDQIIFLRSLAQ